MSTIKAQKMETTNRLKTEIQMKNALPTQTVCSVSAQYNAAANKKMLSAKKRYVIGMKRRRGSVFTRYQNGMLTSSIAASVPRKSHCRLRTPPAIPISSRIGRMM